MQGGGEQGVLGAPGLARQGKSPKRGLEPEVCSQKDSAHTGTGAGKQEKPRVGWGVAPE